MDNRQTLKRCETFISILSQCHAQNRKVAMLLDVDGLIRAEGYVDAIFLDEETAYVQLQGGVKIVLKTIVAVNGIFVSSYAEC